jgi:hypothetical protein
VGADSADVITTVRLATDAIAAFVGGFIAAEGTFTIRTRTSFACAVGLGAADKAAADLLHAYFGVGQVRVLPRRRPHYDDEVRWTVAALRDLVGVIVPFMDEHLPPSHKRGQYLAWRDALLDHWEHRARRTRTCSVDGCGAPHRAHGWCRHHLYVERGE